MARRGPTFPLDDFGLHRLARSAGLQLVTAKLSPPFIFTYLRDLLLTIGGLSSLSQDGNQI